MSWQSEPDHIQKVLWWFITQSNYQRDWKYSKRVQSGPTLRVCLEQKGHSWKWPTGCQWPTELSGGLRLGSSKGPGAAMMTTLFKKDQTFILPSPPRLPWVGPDCPFILFYHLPCSCQSQPQLPLGGERSFQTMFQSTAHVYIPTSNIGGSQFLDMITDTCYCLSFCIRADLVGVKWCLAALIPRGISLRTRDVKRLCMCSLAICRSPLEKYISIEILCLFLN